MAQQNRINQHKGLWFSISVENNEYLAYISGDALANHFGAMPSAAGHLAAYQRNQARIDAVAEAKFLSGAQRPVKLSTIDFIVNGIDCSGYAGMVRTPLSDADNMMASADQPGNQINLRHYQ